MDPILARSLVAFAVGVGLILLGLLLDVPLAVVDRMTSPRRV